MHGELIVYIPSKAFDVEGALHTVGHVIGN